IKSKAKLTNAKTLIMATRPKTKRNIEKSAMNPMQLNRSYLVCIAKRMMMPQHAVTITSAISTDSCRNCTEIHIVMNPVARTNSVRRMMFMGNERRTPSQQMSTRYVTRKAPLK
ncbi:hypothetical protein PENTCL1PPCAC_20643, partial [Pristionchus entomophagus]